VESKKILVVDDESLMRDFLEETLSRAGYDVDTVPNGNKALNIIGDNSFDLILSDMKMPGISGIELLEKLHNENPDIRFIMMTAYGTIETAVEAMKLGAFDYIMKPFSADEIEILVKKAFEHQDLVLENRRLHCELDEKYGYHNIIGESPLMKSIFEMVETVADSRATCLITGPSGTGKELIARAIHYHSSRKDGPFIKTNCAALPQELMESELFGHEKGAFTGAIRKYRGRFERAHGGTLLLDEISEMSQLLQSKLLRIIQEKEVEPVGSSQIIKVDVRLVATTNCDLQEEIKAGRFREDLFYRLNVISIHLPTLMERKGDIPLLINHFIEKYNMENGKAIEGCTDRATEQLISNDWPGNVRELENHIERAVIICKNKILDVQDLPAIGSNERQIENEEAVFSSAMSLAEMEERLILKTLECEGGNRTRAAETLGISVRTLRNKLTEYDKMDAFK